MKRSDTKKVHKRLEIVESLLPKMLPNEKMKSKEELDGILFTLKNYYDTISIMQQEKSKSLSNLRFQYDKFCSDIKEVHDYSNIDSAKIHSPFICSILNSKNVKETKGEIQDK